MKKRSMTVAALCCALSCASAAEPLLFFSKSFPGSSPAYVAITVEPDGAGEYKEATDDASPLKFQLSGPVAAEMCALTEKLDHFKRQLMSPLKVAQMGMETFRFESGAVKPEVKVNFS